MEIEKKFKLTSYVLAVCIVLMGILGYYVWSLSSDIEDVKRQSHSDVLAPFKSQPEPWPEDWDPWEKSWDPSGQFSDLRQHIDDMMNSMLPNKPFFNQHGFGFSSGKPSIDMEESSKAYKVTVEVPKGQEIELNTELSDDTLKISGKTKTLHQGDIDGLSSRLARVTRFSQSIYLADEIDEAGMLIEHEADKIVITIPKI